jgi:plasmid stabilization system protein ParE
MILTWHRDAEREYISAAVYYEEQVKDLGGRFIEQVEMSVRLAMSDPLRPRCFRNGFRKLRVCRFPYALIYRVVGNEVQILAVALAKCRPDYWRRRAVG